jgi:uncharacterized protein YdaU (DUF1376 family)
MAKDPAFLFYPNDWLGGTLGMTFEEKGAYMELLMMQFNRGHMTSHMIGQTVGQIWVNIKDKFIQDEKGLWYNVRLEIEKEKRKKFTESRRNNVLGENQYTKSNKKTAKNNGHMNGHMTIHMENENESENESVNKDFGKSENLFENPQIIPTICRNWYSSFPTYTKDQSEDFKAVMKIVSFLQKQNDITDINSPPNRELIITTVGRIIECVAQEQFWVNKPLKSIANNIQEFLNKIKNPLANGHKSNNQNGNGKPSSSEARIEAVSKF